MEVYIKTSVLRWKERVFSIIPSVVFTHFKLPTHSGLTFKPKACKGKILPSLCVLETLVFCFMLCFLTLHGHQQSRNWLHARFVMHSFPCINKFSTIPNCIFCFTYFCFHSAGPNSKCVSHVRTFAGLQKYIGTIYLPHLLACMVNLNNFVFFQLEPTTKRLPKKVFTSATFQVVIFNTSSPSCSLVCDLIHYNMASSSPSKCWTWRWMQHLLLQSWYIATSK